jgi:hypothetical protein
VPATSAASTPVTGAAVDGIIQTPILYIIFFLP